MDTENITAEEQNQFMAGALQEGEEGEARETATENINNEPEKNVTDNQSLQNGETPPDPQKDFMGYMQWLGKAVQRQEAEQEKKQQIQTPPEPEQLRSFFQNSTAQVKQKYHDFDQAANFVYDMRATQLSAFSSIYPEMADPKIIDEMIGEELKQIVHDCARKNQNPAEVIYAMAQKIGYKNQQNSLVDNIQERKNSARTLSAYNGLSTNGPISLAMIDKMSEAEFSHWINDPKNKATFNRLMGGEDL
ncbi:hypothetical protein [Bartonella sp. F02]|uniref:hypothetical protein n=1 Tax=Bartonella sp. F02 TaxID=2967262 RepID=UPI0022A9F5E2|nr:hypothetical protein [Bartonella sp. F02]MCZ2328874.1 hypothetical protein [Bartonella sp. F02]